MEFSNQDWGSVAMTTEELMQRTQPQYPDGSEKKELTVEDFIRRKWEREQEQLKKQLLIQDVDDWSKHHITPENQPQFPFRQRLEYIGGVDISFVKGDNVNACAAFVVLNYPELEVVHEDLSMIRLTAPYIPGFLAFREADFLLDKIRKLKDTKPQYYPQVVLVDGNGILHPRGFGLASHLGVLADIPMIGIAKNLMYVDGLERNEAHAEKIKQLKNGGDSFPLIGVSGRQHGIVYRSSDSAPNPIYISPGHKISMETSMWVTEKCIQFRVPEPTRQADLRSREFLRDNWDDTTKSTNIAKKSETKVKKKRKQKVDPSEEDQQKWKRDREKKHETANSGRSSGDEEEAEEDLHFDVLQF